MYFGRLILALGDGTRYSRIVQTPQTTAPTISRWKQRFEEQGLAGMNPRHKAS